MVKERIGFYKETNFKDTEIGRVLEDWKVVELNKVSETFSGGTPSRNKPNYWNGNIPWLKSGELNNKFIFSVKEKISEEGLKNSSTKFVDVNTLLIAMYGATAGKVGFTQVKTTINQAICAIVPKSNNFYPLFYFYFLIKNRRKLLQYSSGGAQSNINQNVIKSLKIPLPSLKEQKVIAERLKAIDDLIEIKQKEKKHLERAKKKVMDLLLSGKVRIKLN